MSRKITGYMCGTAGRDELGLVDVTIYPTVDSLKNKASCHIQCGIVKVAVEMVEEIEPANWGKVEEGK